MRNGDCVRQRIACVHRLRNRICIDVSEYLFFLHFLRINSIRTQPISVNPDEPLRPKLVYNQDLVLSSLLSMAWGRVLIGLNPPVAAAPAASPTSSI